MIFLDDLVALFLTTFFQNEKQEEDLPNIIVIEAQRRSGDSYLHSSLRVKLFDVALNRLRQFCRGSVSSPVASSHDREWKDSYKIKGPTDSSCLDEINEISFNREVTFSTVGAVLPFKVTGKSYKPTDAA